jgi:hypothetical protein
MHEKLIEELKDAVGMYLFFSRIERFVIDQNMKKLKELFTKQKNELILLKKLMLNKHDVYEKKLDDFE